MWLKKSRSLWNLKVLVFEEGGKTVASRKKIKNKIKNKNKKIKKKLRRKDENKQQTQPTCDKESGNRTQATLEGGVNALTTTPT